MGVISIRTSDEYHRGPICPLALACPPRTGHNATRNVIYTHTKCESLAHMLAVRDTGKEVRSVKFD